MAYNQPFPLAAAQAKAAQATFGPDLAVRLICPECRDPNPNIVGEFGSGDLVCGNCGLVLGDRIVDTRSEWRTFANDEGDDPSRVGAASDPLLEGIEQLDTVISFRDGGSGIARELQRAASRSQSSRTERNLLTAFRDISNWCDQFSLPKTISDIAKQLYKRSDEEKLLRGKPLDAVIAACIFIVCRQAHVPRTFREICNLTHVSKKTLGQCYKALEQAFNLAPGAAANATAAGSTTGPEKSPRPILQSSRSSSKRSVYLRRHHCRCSQVRNWRREESRIDCRRRHILYMPPSWQGQVAQGYQRRCGGEREYNQVGVPVVLARQREVGQAEVDR